MRTVPAQDVALRAHHTRLVAMLVGLALAACTPSVPLAPETAIDAADYVEVTTVPRPPPPEFIPPRPRKDAVWVDGSWEWSGERFAWRAGTWTVPPRGVRHTRWVVVRRKEDGKLFFAPSTWKNAAGKTVDDARWIHALGHTLTLKHLYII